jgi:hypothetical protein
MVVTGPLFAIGGSLIGIHRIFPLNELSTWRTARDIVIFVGFAAGILWLLSRFRWGVFFLGGLIEFLIIGLGAVWLFTRLFRRAFRGKK